MASLIKTGGLKINKTEVVLAYSDKKEARQIAQAIISVCKTIEIVRMVHTSFELVQVIEGLLPQIVIAEYDLAENDTISVLSRVNASLIRCQFIIASPYEDYAHIRIALRKRVADYLLAPVRVEQLVESLHNCIDYLNTYSTQHSLAENNAASRYLFLRTDINLLTNCRLTIQHVNKTYGTFFSDGSYQALLIKLDSPGRETYIFDNEELQDQIIRTGQKYLSPHCFDVLFNRHSDGISMLINFSTHKKSIISATIDKLFFDVRRDFSSRYHVSVTVCISRCYDDFSKLPEIKHEILDARWYRMHSGGNRGILSLNATTDRSMTLEQKRHLTELRTLIVHYFEVLSINQIYECLQDFFSISQDALSTREARVFIRELIDILFEMYTDVLAQYGDVSAQKHQFFYTINTAQNFKQLEESFSKGIFRIIQRVSDQVNQQYSKPVREAIVFMKSNLHRHLSLTEISQFVGLTPPYFSGLFKKETGENVTDYLEIRRIEIAKKMLKDSNKNISEVADAVGYSEARYFSKVFKCMTKTTPKAYRMMEQKKLGWMA